MIEDDFSNIDLTTAYYLLVSKADSHRSALLLLEGPPINEWFPYPFFTSSSIHASITLNISQICFPL